MQVVPGGYGEVLGVARGDVEDELLLVPGLVQPPIDVERAAVDVAEAHIDVADEELAVGVTHRGASGAAAAGLDEHHRLAPGGTQAGYRLECGRGGGDACGCSRLGDHENQNRPSGLVL